ncbi:MULTISPECIES: Shedu anti-phage system protein SduA domain-containing protein [unclassified Microbacterium]|uniref:Shedu anti-phage system protein SduA domain-containing protein n=1 Tax=unclassified Microbacterium TaxID=2609290 RepID=UPI0012F8F93E|nr:Shedu anti-phage system protein SduA domain-containing protein [Microbacterium sp. MAH-37]
MAWDDYKSAVLADWDKLLDSDPEEAAVQSFLELHPAMIPGGSGDVGPGGHHGSDGGVVFAQPRLNGRGKNFEPDFMWVTRSSALITPILIEIEKPGKRWFNKDGRPSAHFTAAHDQLNEWRAWFKEGNNASAFRERFLFLGDKYTSRPLEPHFVLIFGRRSEFEVGGGYRDPDALLLKRDTQRGEHEQFMTFDSLTPRHDHSSSITATIGPSAVRPFAFSPMYQTTPGSGDEALALGDPREALARSVMMTDERKAYIASRWQHWANVERSVRTTNRTLMREMGRE